MFFCCRFSSETEPNEFVVEPWNVHLDGLVAAELTVRVFISHSSLDKSIARRVAEHEACHSDRLFPRE